MELLDDDSPAPKRGDIIQTNIGDRRQRTWLVLRARVMRRRDPSAKPRYKLWRARWWELEPEMRMALYRSAERNGGQVMWDFRPFPAKKKPRTFEDHMRRDVLCGIE